MSALEAGKQHFRHPPSHRFVKVLEESVWVRSLSECAILSKSGMLKLSHRISNGAQTVNIKVLPDLATSKLRSDCTLTGPQR